MIHKLYIMFENGICVYEQAFHSVLGKEADTQIFTGFLSAIGSFALEALGSSLQSMRLQTGEQLALMKHRSSRIIGICIADGRDHDKILSSLLSRILDRFSKMYEKEIGEEDGALTDKTDDFKNEVELILKRRVYERKNWKLALGVVLGFGLLAVMLFFGITRILFNNLMGPLLLASLNMPILIFYVERLGEVTGGIFTLLIFIVALLFMIPAFVSGFVSGNRKRSLISGTVIALGAYMVLMVTARWINNNLGLDLRGWFFGLSPLIFFITVAISFTAGYLAERVRLYSFEEPKEGKFTKIIFFKRDR